jgi:hypothetical protein
MIFQTIDELDLFLEDLKNKKITTTGKWSLAQILCHNKHPVFGELSKEELIKLHLLHCSNHFSYIHISGD